MVDIQAILQRAYDYGITYIDKGVVANRALTYMLLNGKIISPDINVEDLLNVYFKSCSILANVTDLFYRGTVKIPPVNSAAVRNMPALLHGLSVPYWRQ